MPLYPALINERILSLKRIPRLFGPKLNEQQLDMLRLLKKPFPAEYLMQIRRLAVQLLGKPKEAIAESVERMWYSVSSTEVQRYNTDENSVKKEEMSL